MYTLRLYIMPDNFVWDKTTYTTNRFDARNPIDPAPPLYRYESGTRVVTNGIAVINDVNIDTPAYRFPDPDSLNNYVITITLKCIDGYRFVISRALYGVCVSSSQVVNDFKTGKTLGGYPPNGLLTLNNDSTELTITTDIRTIPYCNGSGYPYNDFNPTIAIVFMHIAILGIDFETAGTQYTITQNLTNCTSDYTKTSELENTQITINLTPNVDYQFLTAPTYTMGGVETAFTQSQTGYTATFVLTNNVVINASATPVTYYNITQNLTGCTSDYQNTRAPENTQITINLTPNTNYRFLTAPTYTMGGVETAFIQSQTGYTATFVLTNNVVINASATECYAIVQSITNATSNYTNDYIIKGQIVTIILTPNAGYYFPGNSCTYVNENGLTAPMTISTTGIASCSFYVDEIYQYSGQHIIADAIRMPSEKYAFIGIYNPTLSQLVTLSQQRFVNTTGLVDLTGYVISLKKYYCNIEIDGVESVYYGTHNTQVMCNTISTEPIDLNCGMLEITELYHNTLDYDNTSITLYLPFIGEITLDTKRVMGKTVNLIYRINPVNGDCIAILSDSISDIAIEQGNIAFQIPIKEHETSIYVNNYDENPMFMADLTPKITIQTDVIYDDNPLHGYDNNIWIHLSECNGYAAFSDVDMRLLNNINKEEIDEIISLLSQGVIF